MRYLNCFLLLFVFHVNPVFATNKKTDGSATQRTSSSEITTFDRIMSVLENAPIQISKMAAVDRMSAIETVITQLEDLLATQKPLDEIEASILRQSITMLERAPKNMNKKQCNRYIADLQIKNNERDTDDNDGSLSSLVAKVFKAACGDE
jgi:hypothetical protein